MYGIIVRSEVGFFWLLLESFLVLRVRGRYGMLCILVFGVLMKICKIGEVVLS